MEKLVSVITPCYNGEKFLHRLLDSLLAQTYKNLEVIFVNDGSTDRTEEVAKSYIPLFEAEGMSFIYICQDNAGQAAALNQGLKIFKGDYLMWPDSDDYLSTDAVELFVCFLEENLDCPIVRSNVYLVEESNYNIIGEFARGDVDYINRDVFMDCVLEQFYWYCPIGYMARSSDFITSNPNRLIYESRGGQNWQMMLPLLYNNRCGYISRPIGYYLVRSSSHSREYKTYLQIFKRRLEHKAILTKTINSMLLDWDTKVSLLSVVDQKYYRIFFDLNIRNNKFSEAKDNFVKLYNKGILDYIRFATFGSSFLNKLLDYVLVLLKRFNITK
ncbi:MAG: glycosyltransferase family A protein [Phocaeicola sp.]